MILLELTVRAGLIYFDLPRSRFVLNRDRPRRGYPFSVVIALMSVLFGPISDGFCSPAPTEISGFSQFYDLTPEAAAEHLPIRIRVTVLCYDAGWSQLYLHDGKACSYINPASFTTNLHRGHYVEIVGETAVSGGTVGWTNLKLSLLGQNSLPPAAALPLARLSEQYGQWIETSGEVRCAETSRGRLYLTLSENGIECRVFVMGKPETDSYRKLAGCRVRVRGINTSQFEKGRLVKAQVMVNDASELAILRPPGKDFLENPVVGIDALFDRELGPWTNRPVHINGLIAAYSPGEFVVIRDPTGVIRARVTQVTRAAPDERVNLWGFLTVSATEVVISDAFFEAVHFGSSEPQAAALSSVRESFAPSLVNPLLEINQVRKLERSEAAKRLPVRLRGVVTYADPDWRTGFLQDSTGAVFFELGQRNVSPGQWVELDGYTDPGGFAPLVNKTSVHILGTTNLPSPTRVDLDDLTNGRLDSHWVEMEGVVRRVDVDGFHLFLNLMSSKGAFKVVVSDFVNRPLPSSLIDCLVRVRGACSSEINDRRQLAGFTLNVPGFQQLSVLEPAPQDPFSIRTTPSGAVAQFDPTGLAGRRIKVSGTVTLILPGEGFFLQDAFGGIRVRTSQTNEVHLGDVLDVLGFSAIGDFAPRLGEAVYQVRGKGPLPRAKRETAEEILARGSDDSRRVTIEAQLLQPVPQSAHPKLILQSGPIIFAARVMGLGDTRELSDLRPGSVLRVSGVCSLQAGERHQAEALRLLIARPGEVEFLSSPPLWTGHNVLMVAGTMAVFILAGLGWVASLRRQVRRQTAAIQEEKNLLSTLIDHLPDNVYVKDLCFRYVLSNRAHARFHGVASPAEFRGKSGSDFFLPEVARAYAEADAKVLAGEIGIFSREEEILNGHGQKRTMVTTKVPLRDQEGRIMGLVGFGRDVTEAKQAERELREKERALSTLMSNLPGLAYRCRNDTHRTMEFLSEGCLALTGFAPSELLGNSGKAYAGIIHPEDRQRVWEEVQRALAEHSRFQLVYRILHKENTEKWVWEQGLGVFSAGGELQALEGFVIDISERRGANEALRISEERFRAVWEHSIDGMRLTDAEGRIIAVNQAFCQLVKEPREKLVGQLFTVACWGDGPADSLEQYREHFQAGKLVPRITARMRFPNGEERDLELSSCFVELGQNQRAVFSILRDISERRRVESVLAYERDLLTNLFDNLPDALYFKDIESRFVRVSKSKLESSWAMALTRHRFGAAKTGAAGADSSAAPEPVPAHLASRESFAEYIVGKTDFDFFDEPRARGAFEDEQQIIRTGQPVIGKVEQTNHLDGRVTWSLSTKIPWRDKDGRVIGTFGVSQDITSIKEAEAQVELVHRQLMEASRQAGMAEVATGVLHNVGNVLNSVNVSATLLSEKLTQSRISNLAKVAALLREHSTHLGDFIVNDPRGRQLPIYIEQLAERLGSEQTSLLNEVGCLAKNVEHIKNIVAMQQSYARPAGIAESVQAVELVEDALRINSGALTRYGVHVLREYEPQLPILTIDKHKVLQILVNLVSNAGHACAQSGRDDRRLTVRVAAADHRLKISVSDNGVGIAPENLTRIFSLGFTTRAEGHGFGLHSGALAAREVGGTLASQSPGPGLGATFVLELPVNVSS